MCVYIYIYIDRLPTEQDGSSQTVATSSGEIKHLDYDLQSFHLTS